jgi:hypothetical protein
MTKLMRQTPPCLFDAGVALMTLFKVVFCTTNQRVPMRIMQVQRAFTIVRVVI